MVMDFKASDQSLSDIGFFPRSAFSRTYTIVTNLFGTENKKRNCLFINYDTNKNARSVSQQYVN